MTSSSESFSNTLSTITAPDRQDQVRTIAPEELLLRETELKLIPVVALVLLAELHALSDRFGWSGVIVDGWLLIRFELWYNDGDWGIMTKKCAMILVLYYSAGCNLQSMFQKWKSRRSGVWCGMWILLGGIWGGLAVVCRGLKELQEIFAVSMKL